MSDLEKVLTIALQLRIRAVDAAYRWRMAPQLLAVTFAAHDPVRVAQFWADVLGREIVEHADGVLLPGDDIQLGLRFAKNREPKVRANTTHLHLTSASLADQQQTVATALDLGARHLDIGQTLEEGHVVMVDPDGNEFCVIEPGNSFLAGCGFLGELACEGTRDLGLYWSEALGWPLVWDQDQETAIQSPVGGTKVAWGGPPISPKQNGKRQHFYLITADDDQETEVDRLVALGASRLPRNTNGKTILADPDGNEFELAGR